MKDYVRWVLQREDASIAWCNYFCDGLNQHDSYIQRVIRAEVLLKQAVKKRRDLWRVRQLRRRMACRRIARNPIVNQYLLKKVYIPRLSDVLSTN